VEKPKTLSPVSAGLLLWAEASLRDEVALGKEEAVVSEKLSDITRDTLSTPSGQAVILWQTTHSSFCSYEP
jgi:uncharacterized protein YheU (UPF0270 family)